MKNTKTWEEGRVKTVTFIVTEDCQLRCNYCYIISKNNKNRMNFDVAKRTVDCLLKDENQFKENSVIWDFIGGEPFLEIDLIDQICDYIKIKSYETNHKWFKNYRFSFSTNGLLYNNKKVQKYIEKNKSHLSISISIDGIREKHDAQRVYPDGHGSYDDVIKVIPSWVRQFGNVGTKATVASEDLPYLKDSVIHLYRLGIKEVNINVIFENVWKEGDDKLYEDQLLKLADYIIDEKIYNDFTCSFFSDTIGKPMDPHYHNENWCGAGVMLAVDPAGNFYPCVRFAPYSMQSKRIRKVGDCYSGIDDNKLRPFLTLDRITQSSQECIYCEIATGCAWCQGFNLDYADTDTIYQRATTICKMHKARVNANRYYWEKLSKVEGIESNV